MVKIGKLVKIAVKIVNSKKIAVIWEQKVQKITIAKNYQCYQFSMYFLPIFSNIYYSFIPTFTVFHQRLLKIYHNKS
jgi:hypothetical protein